MNPDMEEYIVAPESHTQEHKSQQCDSLLGNSWLEETRNWRAHCMASSVLQVMHCLSLSLVLICQAREVISQIFPRYQSEHSILG